MNRKIFRSIMAVAGAVLLASLLVIMASLYGYFGGVQEDQLRDELSLAAVSVEDSGEDYLRQVSSDRFRLTWIAGDGTVLYDTRADGESMENHGDRAEVKQALAQGEGESIRYSSTLLRQTVYCAKRLSDGTVLRISVSRATAGVLALGMFQPILLVAIAALVLSALLARRLSRRIVEPLNSLDLEHPLDSDAYEELSPLLNRINRQNRQITEQVKQLRRRTDEFAQITASMGEGLVLLDNGGRVLSLNPAARKLFAADESCMGQDFLTVDRSREMSEAIRRAMEQGHSEIRSRRGDKTYQFDITRIDSQGDVLGAVILAFDITERESGERLRREFTANVSHELKTPLQGIIGSAELIENGMVKPEDMPRFIGHIRGEAQRMVALIGDIIRLSQLDEGEEMPREDVDLLEVARRATEQLDTTAQARKIAVTVDGQPTAVNGVRQLLYEVIYNLCDNAIKYNVDGGSVRMTVSGDGANACVTVADTGIGIPPEQQGRVFERFYRVDKSHSKASGGTGLGLSIVKHAVQYHGGSISLNSRPGEGTTVRVWLPV